jgi:hypothetical protein
VAVRRLRPRLGRDGWQPYERQRLPKMRPQAELGQLTPCSAQELSGDEDRYQHGLLGPAGSPSKQRRTC